MFCIYNQDILSWVEPIHPSGFKYYLYTDEFKIYVTRPCHSWDTNVYYLLSNCIEMLSGHRKFNVPWTELLIYSSYVLYFPYISKWHRYSLNNSDQKFLSLGAGPVVQQLSLHVPLQWPRVQRFRSQGQTWHCLASHAVAGVPHIKKVGEDGHGC